MVSIWFIVLGLKKTNRSLLYYTCIATIQGRAKQSWILERYYYRKLPPPPNHIMFVYKIELLPSSAQLRLIYIITVEAATQPPTRPSEYKYCFQSWNRAWHSFAPAQLVPYYCYNPRPSKAEFYNLEWYYYRKITTTTPHYVFYNIELFHTIVKI